jgi:tetratricopeptide (TPR) repeat protein
VEAESGPLGLARHYLEVGRPGDALAALERAGGSDPEQPEYSLLRGRALYALERWREGAEAARIGLRRAPHHVGLLNLLALCELEDGKAAEAATTLARGLEIEPQNEVLLANRALVLARLGEFSEARRAVADATRIAPTSAHVLRMRALVAVRAGDREARQFVEELLAHEPEDELAHLLQGSLAAGRKSYAAALRAFDEAARLDPANTDLAGVARQARVAAHPLLAPVRPVWRLGRWRSYFLFLALSFGLAAAGLKSLRVVVVGIWLLIVLLSWTGPRLVRWRARRKYGDF